MKLQYKLAPGSGKKSEFIGNRPRRLDAEALNAIVSPTYSNFTL